MGLQLDVLEDRVKESGETLSWQKIDLPSAGHVLEWSANNNMEGIMAGEDSLGMNLKWLSTFLQSDKKQITLFVLQDEGQILGFVPFLRYLERLPLFSIGSNVVFSFPIIRYSSMGMPRFDPQFVVDDRKKYGNGLLSFLRESLEENAVVFMESIPNDVEFYHWISSDTSFLRYFICRTHGSLYHHRFIKMDGSYEQYLKQLSSKTRSDLIRTRKRFTSRNSDWSVRCYQQVEEVDEFLDHAVVVSKKTWQYTEAGGGLRNNKVLRERFCMTAELGWFRSYILFVNERPIAFQVGHLFQGTFHAQEIGYEPAWAKQQVGIFLHTEIVQDLFSCNKPIKVFDFGNTDTIHKQRLSNFSREEGFVYLLPNSLKGKLFGMCMSVNQQISDIGLKLVDYLRLKERILKKINPH